MSTESGSGTGAVLDVNPLLDAPLELISGAVMRRFPPGSPGGLRVAHLFRFLADVLVSESQLTPWPFEDLTREQLARRVTELHDLADAIDGLGVER
jgi:hypothetical protein